MGSVLLTALFGVLFTLWFVIKALVLGDPVQGYPSLISMITILGGVQLLSIGLLGEYLGKTYYEAKQRPVYLVRDVMRRGKPVQEMARNKGYAPKEKRSERSRDGKECVSKRRHWRSP